MDFPQAIIKAKMLAKKRDRIVYVWTPDEDTYYVSFSYHHLWLFRAYPGGRTELTIKGAEMAEAAGFPVRKGR